MKRKALGTALAAAFGIGFAMAGPAAQGQQVAADQSQQLERIEVTGSYIRRTDTETPSPVQVITAEDIQQTGYTKITDVLNNITANNQGTLSQGFAGAFASGGSGISLRGLTVGATLVLIDGHRMAPYPLSDDGQRSFVDLSSIPLDVVERVEVLKDGASAVYGSDAIAGVVNIILKKTFKGASIAAENGWSQLGGGATSHVTGTFGMGDLSEDGQNFFATVEYRHQDPINMSQRPNLFRQNWTALGGANQQLGANNTSITSALPASGTGYFVNPNVSPVPANFGWLPGCNAQLFMNNQCEFSQANEYWQQVEPATQNLNFLARYTRKLGGSWEGSLTASFFQSQDYILAAFNPPFSTGATTGCGEQVAQVSGKPVTNIYCTPGSFMAPIPNTAAGQAIARQFGTTVGTLEPIQITLNDVGAPWIQMTTQTYRVVGEITGDWSGWDLDASYGWSEAVSQEANGANPNLGTLYNDLANGTYIPGIQNSPSVISSIAPTIYSQYDDILYFASAHGSHDLIALPGGNLSLALGADFYFRSLNQSPSSLLTGGQYGSTFAGDAYAEGNQSDWSLNAEVLAPVFKSLEVDGALRYDHYNSGISDTTPKVGFKWTPIESVALRGTYSKGFRAPNPVESGSSASLGFFTYIADPILCPHPNGPNGFNSPGNFPSQCAIPGTGSTLSTSGLQPEKSTSWTGGVLWEPVRGQSLGIDFYDIKLSDQIISGLAVPSVIASSTILRTAPATLGYVEPNGSIVNMKTPVGLYGAALVPYINLNSTEVRGLTIDIKNTMNLGAYGKLKSELMWDNMIDYLYTSYQGTFNLVGTHGPSEISGDTGTPKNRGKFILTWMRGPVEVTGTFNYIGPYNVTDPSAGLGNCQVSLASAGTPGGAAFPSGNAPNAFCNVASFFDLDLYGGWQINKHWNVHMGIQNVFGREPPLDLQTYASTNFNPSLHLEGAIGRFFSAGAQYRF